MTLDELAALVGRLQNQVRSLEAERTQGRVRSYTVATLPDATGPGRVILVTDETGGAVLAFNEGEDWRRVTDRAVVS